MVYIYGSSSSSRFIYPWCLEALDIQEQKSFSQFTIRCLQAFNVFKSATRLDDEFSSKLGDASRREVALKMIS